MAAWLVVGVVRGCAVCCVVLPPLWWWYAVGFFLSLFAGLLAFDWRDFSVGCLPFSSCAAGWGFAAVIDGGDDSAGTGSVGAGWSITTVSGGTSASVWPSVVTYAIVPSE